MPNFHLFTMLWGTHYIELFKRCCFKSLNWPKNLEAIKGRTWHIFTLPEHFEEMAKIFQGSAFTVKFHEIEKTLQVGGVGKIPIAQCDPGTILLNGLRGDIYWSLTKNEKVLLCPPDTIFGDGTIPNLLALGKTYESCVAVAHARVLPSIIDEIEILGATRGAISNAQLVSLTFTHAHDSWKFAEVGHPKNTSLSGGIAWKNLSQDLYSVCHNLPTHYFCGFTPADWSFWWGQCSFGSFDHRWPGECLIRQERQRYVGSSDACFIVEVTDWDKNVPEQIDRKQVTGRVLEESYVANWLHNSVNKQTSVILRGE